jgi:protein associated with RNAse G/E
LVNDFGLIKVEEHYDPDAFGNFYIILAASDFILSYVNDRSYLDIDIASKLEPDKGFSLSFVKDFLYNPEHINSTEIVDNSVRIKELNDFLKKDFSKISWLFSFENYYNTKKQIDDFLKKRFKNCLALI